MEENTAPLNIPTSELFKLNNRTILITGGLGAVASEITEAIMESGGDVVCFDLAATVPESSLGRFQTLQTTTGQRWTYNSVNVTHSEDVRKAMANVVKYLRPDHPLKGVVTTAGISGESPAESYPEDLFRSIIDINLMGTFLVVQAAANVMLEAKMGGSVAMIASMSGSVANKGVNTSAYNTSKSAILQLTRNLAAEWSNLFPNPPIRVNSLSPGYIHTPLTTGAMEREGVKRTWLEGSMLGRFSQAREYRAPILFLLGEGSSFMTGADLRVDGGHCAW